MADHDAWRELAEIYVSLQMWVLFLYLPFLVYVKGQWMKGGVVDLPDKLLEIVNYIDLFLLIFFCSFVYD